MLDQNTDRMWYVIGAVIVGAAIILILNGTAPELFASVADTFKAKTDETTSVIEDIEVKRNLIHSGTVTRDTRLYDASAHDGGTIIPQPSSGHSTSPVIAVEPGKVYVFEKTDAPETDAVTSTIEYFQFWRVSYMNSDQEYVSRFVFNNNHYEMTIPEGVHHIRVSYPTESNASITRKD